MFILLFLIFNLDCLNSNQKKIIQHFMIQSHLFQNRSLNPQKFPSNLMMHLCFHIFFSI